jgi:hypothetical protein
MIQAKLGECVILVTFIALYGAPKLGAQASAPATFASASSSRILPPAPSYVFPIRKYVYSVQWRFFNAGTSTVQIQSSGAGEQITATADSTGFPDKIFRVHDIFTQPLLSVFARCEWPSTARRVRIGANSRSVELHAA